MSLKARVSHGGGQVASSPFFVAGGAPENYAVQYSAVQFESIEAGERYGSHHLMSVTVCLGIIASRSHHAHAMCWMAGVFLDKQTERVGETDRGRQ